MVINPRMRGKKKKRKETRCRVSFYCIKLLPYSILGLIP
jgi:hypothetical protein